MLPSSPVFLPVLRSTEHLGRVDITLDMVYIAFVNNNLRIATFNKHLLQFLQCTVLLNSIDFRTWHHTVAHLRILEVQGVLEYLYFFLYVILILGILNGALHKIIKVYFRKRTVIFFLIHLYSHHTQKDTCKECCKAADRPQYDEKDVSQWSKERQ